ncbi:MAG: DEAD/DEAH box helicase [Burkholderiales bacterium]
MAFSSLGLAPELLSAVSEQGYTEPTPIQVQAIPVVLQGKDVMALAQTGTGKTAAFTLPLLQRLMPHASSSSSPARHPVRALILTPTRELAAQVEESVRVYGKNLQLHCTVVYGGININPQIAALRAGVEILVATPGRLLDHVQQRSVTLSQVSILVLDEADRMLDMGFIPDIQRIVALLPKERQNLMFSATFSEDIRKLANAFLRSPVVIEVARKYAPAELVTQTVHPVDSTRKHELLAFLIKSRDWKQVLVFTRTKSGANRLARQLQRDGIAAQAIHSDKSQPQRTQTLADFKAGSIPVLVATDIAARGLDIDQLPHVVNFELPHVAGDYVHRIGRTGRAGSKGEAVSLVSEDEQRGLADIERLLKAPIPKQVIAGFEPGTAAPPPRPRETAARAPRGLHERPRRPHSAPKEPEARPSRQPVAASEAKQPASPRRSHQTPRPVAALLGGTPNKLTG